MKKMLAIAIVLALVLSFTACQPGAAPAETSAPASPSETASAPAESSAAAQESAQSTEPTDDSLKKIKDKGTFIQGFDETFMPMGFKDKDGQHKGFDIDMAREFVKRIGVELVLQPIDWNSKELELSSGKIDSIWNGFSVSEERKKNLSLSKSYMANRQVLVVKADSPIQTLADLAGKKVITQEKSAAYDAIMANADFSKSLGEIVQVSDYVKACIELDAGTVDCIAIDEVYIKYYITTNKSDYRILKEDLGAEEYAVGFRKGDAALTTEWNKIYLQLLNEGIAQEISKKWFGEDILIKQTTY